MKNNFFNKPVSNINSRPSLNSEITSQILYGEKFKILSQRKKWIKIKTYYDNYTGYIKKNKFYKKFKPTDKIFKLKSRIFKRKNGKYLSTNSFLYFGIELPTDDLLKVIISKTLSDKQININPKLLDFIINNVERSYEKMFKFLKDVDELSLSTGKSININLIKKVLDQ